MDGVQRNDPGLLRSLLADILEGAAGRTTYSEAKSLGLPQAEGLNPDQTRLLADMPLRQARTQAMQGKANINSLLLRASQGDDKSDLETLKELDKQLSGVNGLLLQSSDPMHYQFATSFREQLGKKIAGKRGVKVPKELGLDLTTKSTGAPKAGANYTETATDARGNKVGFNPRTKKWEAIK